MAPDRGEAQSKGCQGRNPSLPLSLQPAAPPGRPPLAEPTEQQGEDGAVFAVWLLKAQNKAESN